ncbi:hypothetical protein SAMN05444581_1278 [Methylocapsa palsarum]|uniref:Uncharacterized protein n=1 Tax=Methylocapsa palsarum TaxID=1612308 RepID=A0A1I4CQS3_9HYPH|nr:hypothetical protein SAMN05444581_1278 [Methylocapsa palsarum]
MIRGVSVLARAPGFAIAKTGFTMFFLPTSLTGIPDAALCWCIFRSHADLTPALTAMHQFGCRADSARSP